MNKNTKFLIDLVKSASNLITGYVEVNLKGTMGDLVTNFDLEIEKYMIESLKREYPNFAIISEEFNNDNKLTNNCFVIDPIDGTVNFANNIPYWAIQIAMIKNGVTCVSVIYLPKLNELYYADESGAYLNNQIIHVNDFDINRGLYAVEGKNALDIVTNLKKVSSRYRYFCCAAVDFAFVACGRLSAVNFTWNTVWDYIPGEYLVKQSGGLIHNEDNMHIAANSKEFLEFLRNCN